jgi:DNA-binding transcriptional regulator LsrR (DeoR family)
MDSALEALRATVAARRHHLDGATTSTIAGELRVSRFEVARLLDRAVEEGIITFTVPGTPAGPCCAPSPVADIGTTLIAEDASVLEVPGLSDRAVSVTTDELRAVPDVTAVADGADESTAIRAACRSGLVHRPVTDDRTAEALLVSPTAPS